VEKIYLKEVTGLRTIAVLSIFVYHLDNNLLKSGFLGVDVFFVISGFVITNKLYFEFVNKKFNIINFFTGRLTRLYPALIFLNLVLLSYGYFNYYDDDFLSLFKASISSLFYYSNYYFVNNQSYFDINNELQLFLHTWSLSVEEQFYIVFPFIFLFAIKQRKVPKILIVFLSISLLSLISTFLIGIQYFNFKFYAVFFRFWEFLFGSISFFLFMKIKYKNSKFQNIIPILGIIFLILLFFLNPDLENHPGSATISVVFLTCLIILFINKSLFVSKILTSKIFQFFGLTSYSFYLWHDPVIKIIDQYNQDNQFFNTYISYIYKFFITLVISYISYNFIEERIRHTRKIKLFLSSISLILIFFLLTFIFVSKETTLTLEQLDVNEEFIFQEVVTNTTVQKIKGEESNSNNSINKSPQQKMFELYLNNTSLEGIKEIRITPPFSGNKLEGTCFITGFEKLDIDSCTKNIDKRSDNILFVGDSTAHNYFFPFKSVIENINSDQNVYLLSVTGCIPLIDSYSENYDFIGKKDKCEENYKLIKSVIDDNKFEAIFISYRYTYFSEVKQNGFIESSSFFDFIKEVKEIALDNNVILIGQSIEWTEKAANLNRKDLENNSVQLFSKEKLNNQIFKIDEIFKKSIENSNINYFSIIENFCFEEMCPRYIVFGEDLYAVTIDYIHVSSRFGQIISKNFLLNYLES